MEGMTVPHTLKRLWLLAGVIPLLFSCSPDDVADEYVPEHFEKPREIVVRQGEITDFKSFSMFADYMRAFEEGCITLTASVEVEEATSLVVAKWFHTDAEGPDTQICSERLEAKDGRATYSSSMTLLREQFEKFFPEKSFNQALFYCVFQITPEDEEAAFTAFHTDTMTISKALPKGLKVLRIDTVNGEEPTCEYVSPPEGCMGGGIRNCTKVPGRLKVTRNGRLLYDSGDYKEDESGMTLKIRGNTSAYGRQKPYKIKLQKKKDLLFRDDEKKYKDKEWILIKAQNNLNTFIGLETARYLGFEWVPAIEYVNVVVNGDYRGLYVLVESFKRNEDCRVNVTERGFLIEKDAYWWNEDRYFNTSVYAGNMKYTFKYPDPMTIQSDQLNYIRAYVDNTEKSIQNGDYDKYLDVSTFAKWLLFHDIYATLDCGGSNVYMGKKDMTSKSLLEMLSPWDFDSIYYNGSMQQTWSNQHIFGLLYCHDLLKSSNRAFVEAYKAEWKRVRESLPQYILGKVGDLEEEHGEAINTSRLLNAFRYGGSAAGLHKDGTTLKQWLDARVPFLDTNIEKL